MCMSSLPVACVEELWYIYAHGQLKKKKALAVARTEVRVVGIISQRFSFQFRCLAAENFCFKSVRSFSRVGYIFEGKF